MKAKQESQHVRSWTTGRTDTAAVPAVVDRTAFQAQLDLLRDREKAHSRAGDAIAAARRRLPMVEVNPTITLIGPQGPVTVPSCPARERMVPIAHMNKQIWFLIAPLVTFGPVFIVMTAVKCTSFSVNKYLINY